MTATDPSAQAALFAAIARAIEKARAVGKDSQNTFHRYKYASAEAIIEEARGALAAEGVAAIPVSWRLRPREAHEGLGHFADVVVTYMVTHAGGGHLLCEAETPAIVEKGRPEDKATATALTYSLGYFLRGLLMLPRVEGETDADQRDDRDYERRSAPRNGNGQQRPPGPSSKPAAPPFDVEAALTSIAEAGSVDALRALVPRLEGAPEGAKARLQAAYRDRGVELRKAEAASKPRQVKPEAA